MNKIAFRFVKEVALYIATKVGYVSKSPRGKGTPAPRTMLHNMGVLHIKNWERAQTALARGYDPIVAVDVRGLAIMFGEDSDSIHSVDEWVAFAKTVALSPEAKAIVLADAFLRVALEMQMRLDRVKISVMSAICREAHVDADMMHLACTGRMTRAQQAWHLGDYKSVSIPEDFVTRNLPELQAMATRWGKRASFLSYEDASQEMWQYILYYGGRIVTVELQAGKSDQEILRELGGYMKSLIKAVRRKIEYQDAVYFVDNVYGDYREDSDKCLTTKTMDTEMSAMLCSQTLQDLCDEYGVSPEKAILLIKKRLGI